MNSHDPKIEKLFQNLPAFQVGPEADQKILKALFNRRTEAEVQGSLRTPRPSFTLLNLFTMHAKKLITVLAVFLLAAFGIFSYQNNSYAYHLGKARGALTELQAVLAGQARVSLVPRAWAESAFVDETAVVELSTTVVDETEAAIEIVEEKNEAPLLETALEEIHAVQEESLEVLGEAVQAVVNPEAVVTVVAAIETVAQEQAEVQKNLEVVEAAIVQAPEAPVTVEVTTTADVEVALQAQAAEELAEPAAEPALVSIQAEEGENFKVTVCHVRDHKKQMPFTLTVAGPAVRAHLNHGDTLGACPDFSGEITEGKKQEFMAYQEAHLAELKERSHEKALEAKWAAMMERKERAEEKMEMLQEFAEKVKELAESEGVPVSADTTLRHEALLQEARKAYEAGDPKLARALLEESKDLFKKIDELEAVAKKAEETHRKEWFEKRAEAEVGAEVPEKLKIDIDHDSSEKQEPQEWMKKKEKFDGQEERGRREYEEKKKRESSEEEFEPQPTHEKEYQEYQREERRGETEEMKKKERAGAEKTETQAKDQPTQERPESKPLDHAPSAEDRREHQPVEQKAEPAPAPAPAPSDPQEKEPAVAPEATPPKATPEEPAPSDSTQPSPSQPPTSPSDHPAEGTWQEIH